MMIREVSAGSDAGEAGDFVELQMYAAGQHLVAGTEVRIHQGADLVASATFAGNVATEPTRPRSWSPRLARD